MLALVGTALLGTAGCSFIARGSLPFVYDFYFDDFIEDRLTGFMDLDGPESRYVEQQAEEYAVWHRREMLPKFATALEEQAAMVRRGNFGAQRIDAAVERFRALWRASTVPLSQWMAKVMVSQNEQQLQHMESEWRERHREATELARKPPEERIEEGTEKIANGIEDFLVSVEEPQRREIRAFVSALSERPERWERERARRFETLLEALRRGASTEEIQEYLAVLYSDPARLGSPKYREHVAESRRLFKGFLLRFLESLSVEQRRELHRNLLEYAVQCRELSSRGG